MWSCWTGFDHPDCYNLKFHDFAKELQVYGNQHWRSAASTCHTFMTTKGALQRYQAVFGASKHQVQDASQWISITKHRIFNLRYLGRAIVNHDFISRIMVKAWLFCWKQILFGPSAKLWAPVPSTPPSLGRRTSGADLSPGATACRGKQADRGRSRGTGDTAARLGSVLFLLRRKRERNCRQDNQGAGKDRTRPKPFPVICCSASSQSDVVLQDRSALDDG